jgi:inositol transport system ATP-binding protein
MMTPEYILEMEGISKEFPGVKALKDVTLRVKKGKVHALVGENGAGKSTLMKILNGIYMPDSGVIKLKGKEIKLRSPIDALKNGISMIHQELTPILNMTVAENIFLGREPLLRNLPIVNDREMINMTRKLLENLEMNIDPSTLMRNLSVAQMQMVEIAKAISYNSGLIIMDEPTSAISEKEVLHLFKIIRNLKSKGISIIFISHRFDEIYEIADEVTVLRDGEHIFTGSLEDVSREKLIEMMVGRELKQMFPKEDAEIGEVVLEVKNLTKQGVFYDVSFKVRRGEILGIAGLMGAGRTEVVESIFGIRQYDYGEIYVNGKKVDIKSPIDAINNRMALITEDRKTGLFLPLTVEENIIMASLSNYTRGFFVDGEKVSEDCKKQVDKLRIKTPSLSQKIKFLSGGNQQKALIARWLLTYPEILILDEPTRGIDVGAKAEIHKLITKMAQEGKAIIMISSELPEILGMSDRIIVMHEGRVKGELKREEASQEKIMRYAMGLAS